jgi:hypothetical protein
MQEIRRYFQSRYQQCVVVAGGNFEHCEFKVTNTTMG